MSKKIKIETENAPAAIGPYSQAILIPKEQPLIFVSGQLPIHRSTGKLISGTIAEMTKQVIDNLEAILKAAGSQLKNVVRTDVFLKNLQDFREMNEEYEKRFLHPAPARQTIQVADLPLGSPIEISCIAISD